MPLPALTFVIGGASSGKSDFAENLVLGLKTRPIYIATAQAFDDEMRQKIALHKETRGADWDTVEAPMEVARALAAYPKGPLLLDCATLWLSNHLLADSDLEAESAGLLAALSTRPGPTVVVSNEVGQGVVPDNALARKFRSAQGALNRKLAAQSDLVVQVIAGLPNVLKGTLP